MKSIQLEGHGITGYSSELTTQECIILKGLFEELDTIVNAETLILKTENVTSIRNAAIVIKKIAGGVLSMEEVKVDLFDIPTH